VFQRLQENERDDTSRLKPPFFTIFLEMVGVSEVQAPMMQTLNTPRNRIIVSIGDPVLLMLRTKTGAPYSSHFLLFKENNTQEYAFLAEIGKRLVCPRPVQQTANVRI